MKQLSQKLVTENAILLQADKGKTILIIKSDAYSNKVHAFLAAKNLPYSPKILQTNIKTHTKNPTTMQLNHRQRHIKIPNPKKPTLPTLKAQLILHKPNIPIRTVIKNMNAPRYKLAKHLIRMLIEHIKLNNSFIVPNSTNFVTHLKRLKINVNHKMITYDIKDLFINIPIEDPLSITKALSLKNNNTQITQQIIILLRLIVSQTCFIFQNQIYQPEK